MKRFRARVHYATSASEEGHRGGLPPPVRNDGRNRARATKILSAEAPSDFDPDAVSREGSRQRLAPHPGDARFSAGDTSYFTKLAIPIAGPAVPASETRIGTRCATRFKERSADPDLRHLPRARLARTHPERELKPQESVEYKGCLPRTTDQKELRLLKAVGLARPTRLNLGTFRAIAKRCSWSEEWLFRTSRAHWGVAIILMTISVKTLLFPLAKHKAQIKGSMRCTSSSRRYAGQRSTGGYRRRDPARPRDELWKKNTRHHQPGAQVPADAAPDAADLVGALYSALQTAIEVYHVSFGAVHPGPRVARRSTSSSRSCSAHRASCSSG
jgi:hypothetical protein